MSFLDGIEEEGDKLLDAEVDSSTTEEEVEETGAEPEENTEEKFDKAKTAERFQTLTQHNKELKEELEEIRRWKEEMESERSEEEPEDNQIPEWFSELYGDNESAYRKYQQAETQKEERLIEKARKQIESERNQETQAVRAGEDWVDSQLELVQETYGKLSPSKFNELQALMLEYAPTDAKGNLDFMKGYNLMQKMDSRTSNTAVKKNIADTSGSSKTVDNDTYQGVVRVF